MITWSLFSDTSAETEGSYASERLSNLFFLSCDLLRNTGTFHLPDNYGHKCPTWQGEMGYSVAQGTPIV